MSTPSVLISRRSPRPRLRTWRRPPPVSRWTDLATSDVAHTDGVVVQRRGGCSWHSAPAATPHSANPRLSRHRAWCERTRLGMAPAAGKHHENNCCSSCCCVQQGAALSWWIFGLAALRLKKGRPAHGANMLLFDLSAITRCMFITDSANNEVGLHGHPAAPRSSETLLKDAERRHDYRDHQPAGPGTH